jgi:hypothetical protein
MKLAATSSLLATGLPPTRSSADTASALTGKTSRRVRPSDPSWPSLAEWEGLNQAVGGRLIKLESPLAACADNPDTPACQELLRNPFFIGDQPWGTQSTGWADAWMSAPSVYAVAAKSSGDVATTVDFARAQSAPRGQRRRAQLSRDVERTRLAADLDASDERDRAA